MMPPIVKLHYLLFAATCVRNIIGDDGPGLRIRQAKFKRIREA